jgi:hypothetical protein
MVMIPYHQLNLADSYLLLLPKLPLEFEVDVERHVLPGYLGTGGCLPLADILTFNLKPARLITHC